MGQRWPLLQCPALHEGQQQAKTGPANFTAQARERRDKGYLLPSKKISSGAFSKVYLACTTRECMQHNPKLASDLQGKRHTIVRLPASSLWPWAQGTSNPVQGGPVHPYQGASQPLQLPPSPAPPRRLTTSSFEHLST